MARRARCGPAIVAALLAAACSQPAAPPPEPAAPAHPAQPAPLSAALKLPPPRTPLDAYKRTVGQRILAANAAQTFEGKPPDILHAVVVLQFTVDRNGKVTALKTLRSRHPPQERAAIASVRAAGALPAPPASLLRRGTLEIAETWLFRDDGKFQIRSLAEAQAPDLRD
ncbi:MAG: TonB family protein [Burkholderiales bacterium]